MTDDRLKGIKDKELLAELQKRGWSKSEKVIVVGCCGYGRQVVLTLNPWEPSDASKQ